MARGETYEANETPRSASPPDADLDAPVVALDGVSVRYRNRTALDSIDLLVSAGEVVGLLGPNGAGKTTTVDTCVGLRKPTAGSVSLFGRDPQERRARELVGLVPQESGLYDELTGQEQLRLFASLYKLDDERKRVEDVLNLVSLWTRRDDTVSTYSGGMRRRLALARALLHDPRLLVLDEPTLGVDIHGRTALWEHIRQLRAEGRTILLTTNDLYEAEVLCSRVVILNHGRVVEDASPEQLRRRHGVTVLLDYDAPPDAVVAGLAPLGYAVNVIDHRVAVSDVPDGAVAGVIARAHELGAITAVQVTAPTLESVFLAVTGSDE
jgi:ABC-2 type transport system ATP-binding protein